MKAKLLILMSLFTVALVQTGCKTKKDKEKEEQQQAQKDASVEAELKQKSAEDRKIVQAQRELDDQVRIYQAVQGDFEGVYRTRSNQSVVTKIKITVENLPIANDLRTAREGELLAARDRLRLTVDTESTMDGYPYPINKCIVKNLPFDIAAGTVTFDCTETQRNSAGTAKTDFVLALDTEDRDFENSISENSVKARSKSVAIDLLQNKVRSIDALTIKIKEQYGEFTGKLRRVQTE